ncbi:hypothetical protein CesoFtcFv8_005682 [Champsocephalus esox]|uniref:Cadherin Y-type LIR-motif domain-containing protein n=1 Tax=Champsocephalus esox TaxID=159716 RepID=A0AAN8CSY6_9TELE|nr:hypothetical protein CesoFtcFv8_005682 [Champsocephalus esox]
MEELLIIRLDQLTCDPSLPPFDSLQTYQFEGRDSRAESLSSLDSDGGNGGAVGEGGGGMEELNQKFQRLVEIIREREGETAGETGVEREFETGGETGGGTPQKLSEGKEPQRWDF